MSSCGKSVIIKECKGLRSNFYGAFYIENPSKIDISSSEIKYIAEMYSLNLTSIFIPFNTLIIKVRKRSMYSNNCK